VTEKELTLLSLRIAQESGHPGELLELLQGAIQQQGIEDFSEIGGDWLRLMWSIDAYRAARIPPHGMGDETLEPQARLDAVYRTKGNWFSTVLALLLQNRTSQVIQPRVKVEGFSQLHQVDLAWPSRRVDPLVCAEAKISGAPPVGSTPARSALGDFSNRRKELKFAATDLKLYRRQQNTSIDHWDVWRRAAPPLTFSLWGARLRVEGPRPDDFRKLIEEVRLLTTSYLDGAGIVAWRPNNALTGYEFVPLPRDARDLAIDDVLYRIETEIGNQLQATGRPPAPIQPPTRIVPPRLLPDDSVGSGESE
jgi:hypothetical protein